MNSGYGDFNIILVFFGIPRDFIPNNRVFFVNSNDYLLFSWFSKQFWGVLITFRVSYVVNMSNG